MKTDRVLIFAPYELNKNLGGPSGYLAHNLLNKPRDYFCLINDVFPLKFRHRYSFERIFRKLIQNSTVNEASQIFSSIDASSYKYIYFHDCITLYKCIKLISPSQVVILQSHSPLLPSEEYLSAHHNLEMYNYFKEAEVASFQRADLLVFPTKGASEIYNNLIYDTSKLRYILSGASTESTISYYPLDSSKINFLFIGRRNQIKGFDFLMKIFNSKRIRDDVNLILLGSKNQSDEYPNNIFDLGFSNQPMNWANSVDYVINTNKQSYFDLSIIETLSVGAKILMTNNFGHSFYNNLSEDILTFEYGDVDNVVDLINTAQKKSFNQHSIKNINLYENELSDSCYFSRFQKFINEII
jgi:hypothetical protein